MTRFFYILLLLISPFSLSAQKAYKPLRSAAKDKKHAEVIKQVASLRADSLYRDDPKLCIYAINAHRAINDAENTKLYLKQAYDTLTFFSSARSLIAEVLRLDSLERVQSLTGSGKGRTGKGDAELLSLYFPAVQAAGRYFYARGKYADAMTYLQTCITLPLTALGKQAALSTKEEAVNAGLYTLSAYKEKRYAEVTRYASTALTDSVFRAPLLRTLALTAEAQNDTAAYRQYLEMGWNENHRNSFFFTRLADYNLSRSHADEVLRLSDAVLEADTANVAALYAKLLAYNSQQRYADCIAAGKQLLAVDTANVETHYYIGASYVAQGAEINFPQNTLSRAYRTAKQQQTTHYKHAAPYLETYRKLAPDQSKRWAPLLYKVYLALNEGKKFAEMEQILNKTE